MGRIVLWLAVIAWALSLPFGAASAQQTASPSADASEAKPAKIPAAAFASPNMLSTARLSPDGKLIALRAVALGKIQIVLLDGAERKIVYQVFLREDQELEWFRWAGSQRLLVSISGPGKLFDEEIRFTRLFVFDYPSKAFTLVGKQDQGTVGDDLLYVDPAGQFVLLGMQRSVFDWPAVWRFSLNVGEEKQAKKVQNEKPGVFDWYADNAGTVRMGLEFSAGRLKVWYRKAPTDDLKVAVRINQDNAEDKFWDLVRLYNNSDEGFVLEKSGDTVALRKFNFATRTSGDIVYRNENWDVTEVDIGDDGTPKAAYFTDDKERVVWFDPKMKSLQARLERALPGKDIWILSRALDDSRMIVFAGREDDPGALFVYTAASRSLDYVADYRPSIDHKLLARPLPISFAARDKTLIRGYLTLPRGRGSKGLPLIILPHGGPFNVRDTQTYDDEVQFLANRGYAVLQPNFRGSGGFGEAFRSLGEGQIGRKMQDDLDDAMDWAVKEGIADAGRVCVIGSSYGGYAALWAVTRNPERYRCAASFAGVTDWKKQLSYDANFFNRNGRQKWRRNVLGEDKDFEIDTVSPAKQVARLTRPVLLAHGDKDSNVPFSQFKHMRDAAAKVKAPVQLLVFEGEGHGFEKPENEQKWYETLEAFLTAHNPAD